MKIFDIIIERTETKIGNRSEGHRILKTDQSYTAHCPKTDDEGTAVTAIPQFFRVRSEKRVWEYPGKPGGWDPVWDSTC